MSQTPHYTTSEDNFFIRIHHHSVDGINEQVCSISKSFYNCRPLAHQILEVLNN